MKHFQLFKCIWCTTSFTIGVINSSPFQVQILLISWLHFLFSCVFKKREFWNFTITSRWPSYPVYDSYSSNSLGIGPKKISAKYLVFAYWINKFILKDSMPITLIIKLKQMHPKIWISKFWPWVNKLECGREWYFLKACSFTISSSLQLFECSREHNMSHMKRGPWLWIPCLQAKFYKGPSLAHCLL